jgi:hypothetical protein
MTATFNNVPNSLFIIIQSFNSIEPELPIRKVKKVKLLLIKHYAMKVHGGVDVYIHIFLTSALVGGECSASWPGCFTPRERAPGNHWIEGWVNLTASLDDLEKKKFFTLLELNLRPLGRPAHSQLLYWLCYPGSQIYWER